MEGISDDSINNLKLNKMILLIIILAFPFIGVILGLLSERNKH